MTEAEKYLAEKQAGVRQNATNVPSVEPPPAPVPPLLPTVEPPTIPEPPLLPITDSTPGVEPEYSREPVPASRYVMAVIACAAVLAVYVMIAVAAEWRSGGGYVIMAIVFGACVSVWRMITKG